MQVRSQEEIADLVRETGQCLGLTQTELALIAGGFVSKRQPLGKWVEYASTVCEACAERVGFKVG